MRRIWMALFALLLTGCTSTLVNYSPQGISEQEARKAMRLAASKLPILTKFATRFSAEKIQ